MKIKLLFSVLLLALNLQLLAQNQALVGTWILEDQNAGTKEMKIITPTHVSYIVMNTKVDTMMYSGFGTYAIENGKYVEHMEFANYAWDKSKPLAFDYKLAGDKFYQTGSVTFADGRTVPVKNVFTKANLPSQEIPGIVGTWQMVSFQSEGKAEENTDNTKMKLMRIISPTHWMDVAQRVDGKFSHASGGTYTTKAGKIIAQSQMGSMPVDPKERVEGTTQIAGDKITFTGIHYERDGSSHKFTDVFQKATAKKTAKTVSN